MNNKIQSVINRVKTRQNVLKTLNSEGKRIAYVGIVTDMEEKRRDEIFGTNPMYGSPEDPLLLLSFDVVDGDELIDTGSVSFTLSAHKKSNLSRLISEYGDLSIGMKIRTEYIEEKDRWTIIL